jgi:hypothetical protein
MADTRLRRAKRENVNEFSIGRQMAFIGDLGEKLLKDGRIMRVGGKLCKWLKINHLAIFKTRLIALRSRRLAQKSICSFDLWELSIGYPHL